MASLFNVSRSKSLSASNRGKCSSIRFRRSRASTSSLRELSSTTSDNICSKWEAASFQETMRGKEEIAVVISEYLGYLRHRSRSRIDPQSALSVQESMSDVSRIGKRCEHQSPCQEPDPVTTSQRPKTIIVIRSAGLDNRSGALPNLPQHP